MMLRTQWYPFEDLRSTQDERTQNQIDRLFAHALGLHGQWQSAGDVEKQALQGWMLRPYSELSRFSSSTSGAMSRSRFFGSFSTSACVRSSRPL